MDGEPRVGGAQPTEPQAEVDEVVRGLDGSAGDALVTALVALGDGAPLWLAAEAAGVERDDAARTADALVRRGLLERADPARRALPRAWRALERTGPDHATLAAVRVRAAARLAATGADVAAAGDLLLDVPPVGAPWAAEALREAAQDAEDPERAEALLERALEEPVERGVRAEVLLELADARDRRGAGDGAEAARREALRLAPPARRPSVHLLLGRTRFGVGDYRGAGRELERGLAAVQEDDPARIELVAAYVAAARFDRGLEDAAARHLAPVLERDEPGRTTTERSLLAELALEGGIRGRPREEVVDLALRAWADGLLLEQTDPLGIAVSQLAAALTWSDAFADSERVLSAAAEHADRDGLPLFGGTARYLRSWPRLYRGALAEAEADVRAALATPGWEMYEPAAHAVLAHLLIEQGDAAAARATLEVPDAERWRTTVPFAMLLEVRARLHEDAGDADAAARDLLDAGALLDTMGNQSPFCPWRSRLGLLRARGGDLAGARELVGTELDQAEAVGTPRARGVALRARAAVAVLADEDPVPDLEAAAADLESCGARLEHAGVLADLGVAHLADGERAAARARLHEAVALAESLGARETAERAERELRRAGGRAVRTAPGAPGGLTASELRVARLAARGRTNREIAEELVVSPHTVRFHLAGAYRKLGLEGRDGRDGLTAALGAAADGEGTARPERRRAERRRDAAADGRAPGEPEHAG